MPPRVTYYAIVSASHDRTDPGGLLRRWHTEPRPTDEILRRDLQWYPTDFFDRARLGHNDNDYEEISEEEAVTIIERWREKWG